MTYNENRELQGVINPTESVLRESRIGNQGTLQIHSEYYSEELDRTIERKNNTEDPTELAELEKREAELTEAMNRTIEQRRIEEVRAEQEADITRYRRLKEYVKRNFGEIAVVGSVVISLAGILTTVLVAGRTAIYNGASATDKLAKAVFNTFKKIATAVGPYLGPIFTTVRGILAMVLKYGAKGLAWLAQNLWVLAIAIFWFLWDYYKERRRRKPKQ